MDSYSKTETDGLLATKADTTALDGKLDKTAIVTSLSNISTDEQVPSALATKAYVDSKEVKISTEENNKIETKDDGIFVSKDYVEITQAEYDLLTEEEKEYHSFNHSAESRRTYLGGIGKGVVFLSDEQMSDLLDKLSIEEFDYYVGVVADNELKGHRYKKKTHYQAILDMANEDRKTKEK